MKDRSIYTPLVAAERDLRLVDLLPGPRDSDIQCRLRTTTLDTFNLNFDALSYEWGDIEIPRRQIALNDQSFEVRENLWLALQALRSWTEVKTLWIDAICINQNDNDEKNHQVGLMGYIYGKASRVRVWLGAENENSKAAFHLVKEIADCCGDIEIRRTGLYEGWFKRNNSSSNSELISKESQDCPFESWDECWDDFWKMLIFTSDRHPQAWQGLVALLQRTYWTRIWIVQEYLLARVITLHCGEESMDGSTFHTALERLSQIETFRHSDFTPRLVRYIQEATVSHAMHICGLRTHKNENRTLLKLLKTCQNSKSCHPHDRIFALLGLVTDVPVNAIMVDYKRPIFKLKMDVVWVYHTKPAFRPHITTEVCRILDEIFWDCPDED